jgi:hypothetical protein
MPGATGQTVLSGSQTKPPALPEVDDFPDVAAKYVLMAFLRLLYHLMHFEYIRSGKDFRRRALSVQARNDSSSVQCVSTT